MTPRIAVLLEPFPVRNTPNAYAWIGERLCTMLLAADGGLAVPDLRVICGAPAAAHLAGLMPAARPYLIQPATAVQAAFLALATDWHTTGLEVWSGIRSGNGAHDALYAALLGSARASYPFDVLAYWGTNETLRRVAGGLGVPVLWAEYGPVRPPFTTHFCLDPAGVNGLASSRAVVGDGTDGTPGLPSIALETEAGAMTAYEAALTLPSRSATPDLDVLLRFVQGRRRVVLLAMQLSDDANILQFGNGWTCRTMTEAILEAQAGPDTAFIVRPHPAEDLTYHNQAAGQAVRDLVAGRPDVLVFDAADPGAYLACLSVATEVVCINSSAGFEAALLGKPVRVLGQASYTAQDAPPADPYGPAARIPDAALRRLMQDHYVPEERFWSLAFWRGAAAALPASAPCGTHAPPRLPTVEARTLGRTRIGDGIHVDGIGSLPLLSLPNEGGVDSVILESAGNGALQVLGWGVDPDTGGMLAGIIVAAGAQSVWSSACNRRPDVAKHYRDPVRLASGFGVRIQLPHLAAARHLPVRVFGVTTAGRCAQLLPEWEFDGDTGAFVRIPVAAAMQPA